MTLTTDKRMSGIHHFTRVFLPGLIVLATLTGWSMHLLLEAELAQASVNQTATLAQRTAIFHEHLDSHLEKLLALTRDPNLQPLLRVDTPALQGRLEESFMTLLLRNRSLDQACWIDARGRERVRVERREGRPVPVRGRDLLDLSHTDDVSAAQGLSLGQIQIDPIEVGTRRAMEQPVELKLRFITPVLGDQGQRRGLLLLIVDAAMLLGSLSGQPGSGEWLMWVDAEGHWLRTTAALDHVGTPRAEVDSLPSRFPEVWRMMTGSGQTRLYNEYGLWRWVALDPHEAPVGKAVAQAPMWWLVAFLPANAFAEYRGDIATHLAPIVLPGLLLLAIFSYRQACQYKRLYRFTREQQDTLRDYSHLLQEREALLTRHRATIHAALDCIIVMDSAGRIVEFNPAAEQSFGFTRDEVIGCLLSETIVPERYREAHQRGLQHYLETGEGPVLRQRIEIAAVHKDGTEFAVELAIDVARDQSGDIFVAYLRDISERQRTQEALRESQRQFRREAIRNRELLSVASDGVHILDTGGRIIIASASFARILGYAPEEVAGLHVSRWDARFSQEQLERNILPDLFAAEGIVTFETRHRHKNGAILEVEVTAHAASIEGESLLFCSSRDITERKRLQADLEQHRQHLEELVERRTEDLKRNQALLNAIVTTTPNGLLLADRSGIIRMTNAALERMFGYANGELVGFPVEKLLPLALRDGHRGLREAFMRNPNRRVMGQGLDLLGQRQDGTGFPVDISLATFSVQGTDYIQATVMDMTGPKQAELALRELNATLEEKVAARTTELARALTARSEFLANMSHEIRTPLNGILGIAQLLERETLTAGQLDLIGRLRQSGRSLLAIINDILDFSKIEAGQLRLDLQPFGLGSLLAQVGSVLGGNAHAKGIELCIEPLPDTGDTLIGDSLRIEQVLVNLIGNAIKFTTHGEVRVRVAVIALSARQAQLRFEVRDTGIGIERETLGSLFQPFTQADPGITRRFGGTGLGLSICKRLVELMGGKIGVDSVRGSGSTFWFELPLERAERMPASRTTGMPTPTPAAQGPRLVGLRVLIADDTRVNRLVVQQMLRNEGAQVVEVADGLQALDYVRAAGGDRLDAVLMDVQMPVMDGLTATRAIRGELGFQRLPVIAFTAGVLPEQRREALMAGCNDFVAKPVDLEELVAVLLRWTTVPGLDLPAESAEPTPAAALRAGLDLQTIAQALGGHPALVIKVLRQLMDDFADAASATRGDLAQGDRKAAEKRLHALRGAVGFFNATELIRVIRQLEEGIHDQRTDLESRLTDFATQLDLFFKAAEDAINQLPPCVGP